MKLAAEIFKILIAIAFAAAFFRIIYIYFKKYFALDFDENPSEPEDKSPDIDENIKAGSLRKWWISYFKRNKHNIKLFFTIAIVALSTRLMIFALTCIFDMLFLKKGILSFQDFQQTWRRWDSNHFISIAQFWYTAIGERKLYIVFYPLYPIAVRFFNGIFNNYFISGLAVSNVSLVFSCFYLYKLTALEFNKRICARTVKLLLVFPFSFFLGIVYSDSLFLALSIAAFYNIRRRKWLLAGGLGALAAMTRNFGILLLLPCIMEYFTCKKSFRALVCLKELKNLAAIALIPIGGFVYFIINKIVTGGWFTFMKYQHDNWHQNTDFFWENAKSFLLYALPQTSKRGLDERITIWIPLVCLIVLAVLLIFYSLKKLRPSYTAYMLVYMAVCLTPTWLISGPRYIMGLFPMYMLIARAAKNTYVDYLLTVTFSILLCIYTLAFTHGFTLL